MIYFNTKYGAHRHSKGFIGELGKTAFNHKFGRSEFSIIDNNPVCGGPTLLITLDLNDPSLNPIHSSKFAELPLVSYINCSVGWEKQIYRFEPKLKTVYLVHCDVENPEMLDQEDLLPNPLPERDLRLRPMYDDEVPLNESLYWKNCGEFLGGHSFIRILGEPIWLQQVEEVRCSCGTLMKYIASIGYENITEPAGYVDNLPFFIGEGALYFFLCPICQLITVTSQSS